jgi:hypothetical protein
MFKQEVEELAFNCLRYGRQFGHAFEKADISMPPKLAKDYRHLLVRLSEGEVLCLKEFQTLESVARALRSAMNDFRPGYGDRAFGHYTGEDIIFEKELEQMRQAAECYKSLIHEHEMLRDRFTAMRWSKFKSGQS